ncbi:tetratricopeptide repeat protein [Saccharopolyspora shandongensis]|uniref:tetratricopeptide repeat protein n=1 Tax=Saccharopolyspora shandongensis TaxID=418495 RepID=UPI00340A09D7
MISAGGERTMADVGNRFDGTADAVVQGRDFHGDVHFYPPSSPKAPPRQVPPPSPHYTNNERQLAEITKFLLPGEVRDHQRPGLVVLRGEPGGGKSATAYQWIHEHGNHYQDGLFYASLTAGMRETGLESEALHNWLLGVGYARDQIPATLPGRTSLWLSWSTGKRVAVVIDDAITEAQVRALLPGMGNSVVLVTEARSLGALRVSAGAEFVPLDPLSADSARLLVSRIVGGTRDLARESEQVDELIGLCDGQTTALCVAASLLVEFPDRPVARWVRELSREGRRLAALSRDENLSVLAVFNTAVGRLDDRARQVYAAFGQHPGTGDVSLAALSAAVAFDEDDVQDALDRLSAAHLVREVGEDRYFAYSLVREHSRARFPGTAMRARFDEFYLRKAIAAGHAVQPRRGWLFELWPELRDELAETGDGWDWLDAERANVRAVARGLHDSGSEQLCRLAVALWPFQEQAKYVDDMDVFNKNAVEVATAHGWTFAAGLAAVQRGFAFRARGEYDKAATLFAEGEELARRSERVDLAATAVESLGISLRDQGDRGEARIALRRNMEMAEVLGVPRRTALARMHLGSVDEPEAGVRLLDQALSAFEELGEGYNAAKTRMWRGKRLTELGRYADSEAGLTSALAYMTAHHKRFDQAQILLFLGENARAAGDAAAARQHFTDAVALCRMWGFAELAQWVHGRLDEVQS